MKPYELMNMMNGGGINLHSVEINKIKNFIRNNEIITDERLVKFILIIFI